MIDIDEFILEESDSGDGEEDTKLLMIISVKLLMNLMIITRLSRRDSERGRSS